MAGENDGGTQAAAQQQTSGQADAQQQQQAGQNQQADAGVGKHTKTDTDGNAVVSDNGGAAQGKHATDGAYQAAVSTCLNSPRRMVRAGAHAKEIMIPKIAVTGLGDYTRKVGYK